MTEDDKLLMSVWLTTDDPESTIGGQPVPVLTTLLHKVCDNDRRKFEEMDRCVSLLMRETLTRARQSQQ